MPTLRNSILFACLSLAACTATDNLESDVPEERAAMQTSTLYAITPTSALSDDQLHAIARFVEAQAEDVQQAKVAVLLDDDGSSSLEIEMRGASLPGPELADALRAEFEVLADAEIDVVEGVEAGPGPELPTSIEPGDDAETIEQKVIADLRAKGVEGEIDVTVTPTQDGHHAIEVQVEDRRAP